MLTEVAVLGRDRQRKDRMWGGGNMVRAHGTVEGYMQCHEFESEQVR